VVVSSQLSANMQVCKLNGFSQKQAMLTPCAFRVTIKCSYRGNRPLRFRFCPNPTCSTPIYHSERHKFARTLRLKYEFQQNLLTYLCNVLLCTFTIKLKLGQ